MKCGGLWALFAYGVPDLRSARTLADHGRPATGSITAVYDYGHNRGRYAKYTYTVESQAYQGRSDYEGSYGDRGPIGLYYLPEDPVYSDTNPQGKFHNAEFSVGFLVFWNACVLGFLYIVKGAGTRGKRRSRA